MAMAGKITVAEVEELVLQEVKPKPNTYTLEFLFREFFKARCMKKRIEQLTVRKKNNVTK